MVTHQLPVEHGTEKVCRSKTGILLLCHGPNQSIHTYVCVYVLVYMIYVDKIKVKVQQQAAAKRDPSNYKNPIQQLLRYTEAKIFVAHFLTAQSKRPTHLFMWIKSLLLKTETLLTTMQCTQNIVTEICIQCAKNNSCHLLLT